MKLPISKRYRRMLRRMVAKYLGYPKGNCPSRLRRVVESCIDKGLYTFENPPCGPKLHDWRFLNQK